jgi:hypothetical protein
MHARLMYCLCCLWVYVSLCVCVSVCLCVCAFCACVCVPVCNWCSVAFPSCVVMADEFSPSAVRSPQSIQSGPAPPTTGL